MANTLEQFDIIFLGTGFTQCILAALFSKDGKKILLLDQERFSGGANGSIGSREELQEHFDKSLPQQKGEWNVDLVPKLFLKNDPMLNLLEKLELHIKCKPIHNIFLYQNKRMQQVPNSNQQINESNFIPESDKQPYKELIKLSTKSSSTRSPSHLLKAEDYLKQFKLSLNSTRLLLHGMTINCKAKKSGEMLDVLNSFCSAEKYHTSAVLYPLYGVGEITNCLIKLVVAEGGRCMLNRPVTEVKKSGGMVMVTARGLNAMSKFVVGDSTYFKSATTAPEKIIRCLCLLKQPVAQSTSSFITVPAVDTGSKHDTYVLVTGSEHGVTPNGVFLAHLNKVLEGEDPQDEISKTCNFLKDVSAMSIRIEEKYCCDNESDKVFVTSSYDFAMNWNDVVDDVTRIYEAISRKTLKLEKLF